MKKIDFLCEAPSLYIFQKEKHKTNFGGVLFLIYAIIILIISISYIYDYYSNPKYVIEYLKIKNQLAPKEINYLNENPDYNPFLEFKLSILNNSLCDNFTLIYIENNEIKISSNQSYFYFSDGLEKVYPVNSSASDLDAFLAYNCGNDPNCTIYIEDEKDEKLTFRFRAPQKRIDHQNQI